MPPIPITPILGQLGGTTLPVTTRLREDNIVYKLVLPSGGQWDSLITVDAQSHAVIDMTLTSAACPLTDVIEDQTAQALEGLVPTHRINWVWMPPWGPDKITDDGREQLRALGFNV